MNAMADEAQLGLPTRALAVEASVGIGCALMGVVGASLAMEVGLVVPTGGRRRVGTVLQLFIEAQASIIVSSTLPLR